VLKALKKSNPGLIAEKRKREDIFNAVVTKALAAKLALYPTSINDDERLLKVGSLEKRHRMAIEVRLGEKRLLHEALALLQGGQDEVKGQTGKKAKRKE
jgi:SET domain-containing protein 6